MWNRPKSGREGQRKVGILAIVTVKKKDWHNDSLRKKKKRSKRRKESGDDPTHGVIANEKPKSKKGELAERSRMLSVENQRERGTSKVVEYHKITYIRTLVGKKPVGSKIGRKGGGKKGAYKQ